MNDQWQKLRKHRTSNWGMTKAQAEDRKNQIPNCFHGGCIMAGLQSRHCPAASPVLGARFCEPQHVGIPIDA